MEKEVHEQYEYARRRIKQKKNLYFHFVLFLIGSLFMFAINVLLKIGKPTDWYIWGIIAWFFVFILHFINVYITNRFMNKNWEREQIEKLVAKQQNKLGQLESKAEAEYNKNLKQ
ncbi:MAG TPA: 2TM domain-containing protein [Flavobacterium sp.]|jgi:phosphotransferase system  glucose/maltose/N-acetylglucosamine-specific IIC component